MQPNESNPRAHVAENIAGGIVFALLGAYVLLEAQKFEGVGAVTPVFVGAGLIVLSALLIVVGIVRPRLLPPSPAPTGSLRRRGLLVALVIAWVAALPFAGFLLSSLVAFALISASVPVDEPWTRRGIVLHALGGGLTIVAFWLVMTTQLNVPLPRGALF